MAAVHQTRDKTVELSYNDGRGSKQDFGKVLLRFSVKILLRQFGSC